MEVFEKGYTYFVRKSLFIKERSAMHDHFNYDFIDNINGKEVDLFIPGENWASTDGYSVKVDWCEKDVKFENGELYNKLSKTEHKVDFILEHFPETRDDNYKLMNKYALYELGKEYPEDLYDLHLTSVMRARRKLQNTLHLHNTKAIIEENRQETQAVYQEYYGTKEG
jgi:hypothetical protein